MRRRVLPVLLALPLLGGCGGGSDRVKGSRDDAPTSTTTRLTGGAAKDAAVVRRWADRLRRGDVAAAARLFALPAKVQNGSPLLTLRTRSQVRGFNRTLPCGAKLLSALPHHGYVIAEFRLTDRRGPGAIPGCPGKGNKASTAFKIRHGLIVEWRRVLLPGEKGSSEPAPGSPT